MPLEMFLYLFGGWGHFVTFLPSAWNSIFLHSQYDLSKNFLAFQRDHFFNFWNTNAFPQKTGSKYRKNNFLKYSYKSFIIKNVGYIAFFNNSLSKLLHTKTYTQSVIRMTRKRCAYTDHSNNVINTT